MARRMSSEAMHSNQALPLRLESSHDGAMAFHRKFNEWATAGLSGGFALAVGGVLKVLEHFHVALPDWIWTAYGVLCAVVAAICALSVVYGFWTSLRAKGWRVIPIIVLGAGVLLVVVGAVWGLATRTHSSSAPPDGVKASSAAPSLVQSDVAKADHSDTGSGPTPRPTRQAIKTGEADAAPLKPKFLIQCFSGGMAPQKMPDIGEYYEVDLFYNPKNPQTQNGGNMGRRFGTPGGDLRDVNKAREEAIRCEITNYSGATLVAFRTAMSVTFLEIVPDGESFHSGKILITLPVEIDVPKIDPGPSDKFTFFVQNYSPFWAKPEFGSSGVAKRLDSGASVEASIEQTGDVFLTLPPRLEDSIKP